MGIAQTLRGRLTPAIVVAVLVVLVAIVTLGALARPAAAQSTFVSCASSIACHNQSGGDAFHGKSGHQAAASCATCHVNGFGAANAGVTPNACMTCHAPASAVVTKTTHTAQACGTTSGCHGVPSPTPTPTATATVAATTKLTAKVAPTTVKVRRKVKVSGLAGPLPALVSAKVAFRVDRKVGTKWVKMKTGTATVGATGAYAWSYKVVKKGSHRVTVSIAKTTKFTAKKLVKTFKVR
jgi:hypothetical protein